MNKDENQVSDILKQLKDGAVLVKRKLNGKKYSRRFFLHEREELISYRHSRRIFGKPRICKWKMRGSSSEHRAIVLDHIRDIDEIRTGFHGQTFHRLRQRGIVKADDVNTLKFDHLIRSISF